MLSNPGRKRAATEPDDDGQLRKSRPETEAECYANLESNAHQNTLQPNPTKTIVASGEEAKDEDSSALEDVIIVEAVIETIVVDDDDDAPIDSKEDDEDEDEDFGDTEDDHIRVTMSRYQQPYNTFSYAPQAPPSTALIPTSSAPIILSPAVLEPIAAISTDTFATKEYTSGEEAKDEDSSASADVILVEAVIETIVVDDDDDDATDKLTAPIDSKEDDEEEDDDFGDTEDDHIRVIMSRYQQPSNIFSYAPPAAPSTALIPTSTAPIIHSPAVLEPIAAISTDEEAKDEDSSASEDVILVEAVIETIVVDDDDDDATDKLTATIDSKEDDEDEDDDFGDTEDDHIRVIMSRYQQPSNIFSYAPPAAPSTALIPTSSAPIIISPAVLEPIAAISTDTFATSGEEAKDEDSSASEDVILVEAAIETIVVDDDDDDDNNKFAAQIDSQGDVEDEDDDFGDTEDDHIRVIMSRYQQPSNIFSYAPHSALISTSTAPIILSPAVVQPIAAISTHTFATKKYTTFAIPAATFATFYPAYNTPATLPSTSPPACSASPTSSSTYSSTFSSAPTYMLLPTSLLLVPVSLYRQPSTSTTTAAEEHSPVCCSICNCLLLNRQQQVNHLTGRKHTQRLRMNRRNALVLAEDPGLVAFWSTGSYRCDWCQVSEQLAYDFVRHLGGARHQLMRRIHGLHN